VVGLGINPSINEGRTPQSLVRQVEATVPQGQELLLVDYREQFLLFASRPLNHLPYHMPAEDQARLAARWQADGSGRWVLGPKKLLARHFGLESGIDLGERHSERWWLLPPGSARPSGPSEEVPICRFMPVRP
jgi:hypothetical protein